MKLKTPTPVFRFYDENKTREFYIGFLHFKLDWDHRFEPSLPLYMQISRGDCVIHLTEHFGDAAPGATARIKVEDIDAYRDEITETPYKHYRPGIEKMPWGRDMSIIDPAFNRLIFFEPAE